MAELKTEAERNLRGAQQRARRETNRPWVRNAARAGYAAKGVVYIVIGVLAIQTAVGAGGTITDQKGALVTIYQQPFGRFLLAIVALGLFAYGLWSFIQATLDVEHKGTDLKGVLTRIGYGAVGVTYVLLAIGAARFDAGLGSAGKSSNASARDWTARLLSAPAGVVLVVLVGLIVIGIAASLLYRAYAADFRQQISAGGKLRDEVIWLGRLGYAALGFVFCIVGLFLIVAAVKHNPHEARGLSGALETLVQQPFGPVLLALVAIGLFAYGLFSLAEARYRRLGAAS